MADKISNAILLLVIGILKAAHQVFSVTFGITAHCTPTVTPATLNK